MYWIVFVYLFLLSFYAFGEQLTNQDVDETVKGVFKIIKS